MNINKMIEFNNCLSGINNKTGYVSFVEDHFTIIDEKERKTLRTADIAAAGQEALYFLASARGTFQEKSYYYEELGKGLQDYGHRLWNKKSLWQKIGWYFNQGDADDYKVHYEAKTALAQARKLRHDEGRIARATSFIRDMVQESLKSDDIRMRLFYHSVLDSSSFCNSNLDGLPLYATAPWMLNHLEAFRKQYGPSDPWVPTLDALIQELKEEIRMDMAILEAMRSLEVGIESPFILEELFGMPFKSIASIQDWIYSELFSKIYHLKPGEEYLFHGGYCKSKTTGGAHAVRISFVSQQDGSIQMSFINTGEGSEPAALSWKTVRQSGKELLKTAVGKQVLHRRLTQDDVWTGIPLEAFTEELLNLLVLPRFSVQVNGMAEIKANINAYFARYPAVKQMAGRSHKLQNKGSCAMKSLTASLHAQMDQIDPLLFRRFKVFYTDREIAALPNLLKSMQTPSSERATITEQANQIRVKRYGKANPGYLQKLFLF